MAYKAQIKKALNKKNLKHKYVSKSIKKKIIIVQLTRFGGKTINYFIKQTNKRRKSKIKSLNICFE